MFGIAFPHAVDPIIVAPRVKPKRMHAPLLWQLARPDDRPIHVCQHLHRIVGEIQNFTYCGFAGMRVWRYMVVSAQRSAGQRRRCSSCRHPGWAQCSAAAENSVRAVEDTRYSAAAAAACRADGRLRVRIVLRSHPHGHRSCRACLAAGDAHTCLYVLLADNCSPTESGESEHPHPQPTHSSNRLPSRGSDGLRGTLCSLHRVQHIFRSHELGPTKIRSACNTPHIAVTPRVQVV